MKIFIIRLLRKLNVLRLINFNTTIELKNKKIIVPVSGGIGFDNMNMSELWMLEVLGLLGLPDEKVFIDVGVNTGQTLIKFKTIYPDIEYIGFEPNPSCVKYTEQLSQENGWKNISIVPAGIAEDAGLAVLEHYSDSETDSSASIVSNYRGNSEIYKREIVTILNVENVKNTWKDKKISAIKIDVEGAELGVIKSFQPILKQDRPYLLIEILPVYNTENRERLESQLEIEKILEVLDYKIYRIHRNIDNQLDHLELIESIGIHDRLDWCDYVFSPQEMRA